MTVPSVSSRTGLFGLAALLAAGVACGGDGPAKPTEAAAKIVTTTSTVASTRTTAGAMVEANFDDLSRLLVANVPAAYKGCSSKLRLKGQGATGRDIRGDA